jgi:hypothetical protein
MGGKGQPRRFQHCDTRKDNLDLLWNPANPAHHIETRIRYEADGKIRSDDPDFDAQLDEVLNLNIVILKNNRRGVLDAILSWWQREKISRRGPIPRTVVKQERDRLVGEAGEVQPFCQVAVWWLERRLARTRS